MIQIGYRIPIRIRDVSHLQFQANGVKRPSLRDTNVTVPCVKMATVCNMRVADVSCISSLSLICPHQQDIMCDPDSNGNLPYFLVHFKAARLVLCCYE